MVIYDLTCENDHRFEVWFPDAQAFDRQKTAGLVYCEICGSLDVRKIPSGGHVGKSIERVKEAAPPKKEKPQERVAMNVDPVVVLKMMHQHVKSSFENVGPKFAEEAKKIHEGESEKRDIYGTTTPKEQEDLSDEGIPFFPLPDLPDEFNN